MFLQYMRMRVLMSGRQRLRLGVNSLRGWKWKEGGEGRRGRHRKKKKASK